MNTIAKLNLSELDNSHSLPSTKSLHVLALHGWGCDSRTWQPLADFLQPHFSFEAIDLPGFGVNKAQSFNCLKRWQSELLLSLPENCVLLGWSLGGMLATQLAATSNKVLALISLATNVQFAASEAWPQAMEYANFSAFRNSFSSAPEATLKRFYSLQAMGDARRREVLKFLQSHSSYSETLHRQWQLALDTLAAIDNRQCFAQLGLPGLHVFGNCDSLVPLAAAKNLQKMNYRQSFEIMQGVGHVPHISQPEQLATIIRRFISEKVSPRKNTRQYISVKKAVAKNFSKAANTYDDFARLQKQVQQCLINFASGYSIPRGVIADLGCGTGKALAELKSMFPSRPVFAVDLAAGMLQVARQDFGQECLFIQGDIEQLPFKSNALSLCFSSLSVQWCQPESFLRELYRVIMPGGLLVFSTLGPATLFELRQSWQQLDNCKHVNQFVALSELKSICSELGFVDFKIEEELRVLRYGSVKQLMRELKGIGARNINPLRRKGLSSARQIAQLERLYSQNYALHGKIPASYQVFYFAIRKSL